MKESNNELYENVFDQDVKYKLYRNVYEIIHPTISKKNISEYKIMIHPELCPLRIFYPNKIASIDSVIIFIHGDPIITGYSNNYAKICRDISKRCNKLVIALDYKNPAKHKFPISLDECYRTIKYLYEELTKLDIKEKNIILMGDSFGANLLVSISYRNQKKKQFKINKEVLIYPIFSTDHTKGNNCNLIDNLSSEDLLTIKRVEDLFSHYINKKEDWKNPLIFPLKNNNYKSLPTTLVVTGGLDPLKNDGIEYHSNLKKENNKTEILNIPYASHGFLNNPDEELQDEFYDKVNKFLTF